MRTLQMKSLDELVTTCNERLTRLLSSYLQSVPSLELKSAMEYSLMNGGKRLRPLLVYASGSVFNAPHENLDVPASAVELIHTYALMHDDLPCMDDADLRRGKPSCHKSFGEGQAVLAGDALLTLAMQIMASHPAALSADKRLQMITTLSLASGPYGMAAGQALDLTAMSNRNISPDLLLSIYELKTGVLISTCIELGRLASKENNEFDQMALKNFGDAIGLAFQIQDDILDIESTAQILGKAKNMDNKNNKMTYPILHGVDKAKIKVEELYHQALEAINYLGGRAQILRELTGYMLNRHF